MPHISLYMFSPFNGYDSIERARESGALYHIGDYDNDRCSYTPMQDAIEVAEKTAEMIGASEPVFVLSHGDIEFIEIDELDEAMRKFIAF